MCFVKKKVERETMKIVDICKIDMYKYFMVREQPKQSFSEHTHLLELMNLYPLHTCHA